MATIAFIGDVMLGRGVDNLITDDPALARAVIQERAALGASERALLALAEVFGVTAKSSQQ